MNCIRTPEHDPRASGRRWASRGSTSPATRATSTRSGAPRRQRHRDPQNRTHKKLIARLRGARLRAPPADAQHRSPREDPASAATASLGCQKGCKQSTMKTFLQDAADAGARFVVGCARRADPRRGRPRERRRGDGHPRRRLDHDADRRRPDRGGGLRRDRVAGPAAALGHRRPGGRQAPAAASRRRSSSASTSEPIEGWIGQIQSALSDQFNGMRGRARLPDRGHHRRARDRSRCRCPWRTARTQAAAAACSRSIAPFISVARDHGEGEVVLDAHGRAVTRWSLRDEVDARLFRRAMVELARLHQAGGRARDHHLLPAAPTLAPGRGLRGVPGGDRGGLAAPNDVAASPRTRWAPAGWAPTRRVGRRRPRPAARHRGRLDRRRLAPSPPRPASTR